MNLAIREAFHSEFSVGDWKKPIAVTLTVKKTFRSPEGIVFGNEYHYAANLRHVLNLANRQVYGCRWRRRNTRLRVIPVREKDQSGRLHYHLLIDAPEHWKMKPFAEMLISSWKASDWGYHQAHCEWAYDASGWLRYLTKARSKTNLSDAIDWDNLNY